jgi:hypothetical protein
LPSKPQTERQLAARDHDGEAGVLGDRRLEQPLGFCVGGDQRARKPQTDLEHRGPRLCSHRLERRDRVSGFLLVAAWNRSFDKIGHYPKPGVHVVRDVFGIGDALQVFIGD